MLDLSSNQITEMNGFNNLFELRDLILNKNRIYTVKGLKNLQKLRLLSFRGNPAEEFHPNYGLYSGEDLFLNEEFP